MTGIVTTELYRPMTVIAYVTTKQRGHGTFWGWGRSVYGVNEVMLNKSVLNYYSHFSSLFPDFFAIVFYSSRCIVSDKKKSRDIKK